MDVALENGQHTQSTKLCNVVIEFWGSSGERSRWQQVYRIVQRFVYDLILGMEQLNHFNPIIYWKSRAVQVQGLIIKGFDCGLQVQVELCSWKRLAQTAKHTGNPMFLCTLSETGKVPTVHMECSVLHYIVGSLLCCAAATSEVKELATPDPGITQLCTEFVDVFDGPGMPSEHDVTHDIVSQEGATLSKPRLYRMSPDELTEVQRQLEEYIEKGWIKPSTSPYGAPILFVRKSDSSLRMCIDYRALSQQTSQDNYPIPRINDLLDRLLSAIYFSKLDLAQGYHQVAITPGHEHKTALLVDIDSLGSLYYPLGFAMPLVHSRR